MRPALAEVLQRGAVRELVHDERGRGGQSSGRRARLITSGVRLQVRARSHPVQPRGTRSGPVPPHGSCRNPRGASRRRRVEAEMKTPSNRRRLFTTWPREPRTWCAQMASLRSSACFMASCAAPRGGCRPLRCRWKRKGGACADAGSGRVERTSRGHAVRIRAGGRPRSRYRETFRGRQAPRPLGVSGKTRLNAAAPGTARLGPDVRRRLGKHASTVLRCRP